MLTKAPRSATRSRRYAASNALVAAKGAERAFTLVELMVVVSIVGVLATLATYGVRKYLLEAKKAEATSMLAQIRAAEESYKDETFKYLGLDSFDNNWHPTNVPFAGKTDWAAPTDTLRKVFKPLGVKPDGPVAYSYAVVAGESGDDVPTIPTVKVFNFPTPTGPFYIAMAKADLNGDGEFTYALSHSDTSEIYVDETF